MCVCGWRQRVSTQGHLELRRCGMIFLLVCVQAKVSDGTLPQLLDVLLEFSITKSHLTVGAAVPESNQGPSDRENSGLVPNKSLRNVLRTFSHSRSLQRVSEQLLAPPAGQRPNGLLRRASEDIGTRPAMLKAGYRKTLSYIDKSIPRDKRSDVMVGLPPTGGTVLETLQEVQTPIKETMLPECEQPSGLEGSPTPAGTSQEDTQDNSSSGGGSSEISTTRPLGSGGQPSTSQQVVSASALFSSACPFCPTCKRSICPTCGSGRASAAAGSQMDSASHAASSSTMPPSSVGESVRSALGMQGQIAGADHWRPTRLGR